MPPNRCQKEMGQFCVCTRQCPLGNTAGNSALGVESKFIPNPVAGIQLTPSESVMPLSSATVASAIRRRWRGRQLFNVDVQIRPTRSRLTPCVLHRVGYDRSEQTRIALASGAACPVGDQVAHYLPALYQDVPGMKTSSAICRRDQSCAIVECRPIQQRLIHDERGPANDRLCEVQEVAEHSTAGPTCFRCVGLAPMLRESDGIRHTICAADDTATGHPAVILPAVAEILSDDQFRLCCGPLEPVRIRPAQTHPRIFTTTSRRPYFPSLLTSHRMAPLG
jgi:hypothetical protein